MRRRRFLAGVLGGGALAAAGGLAWIQPRRATLGAAPDPSRPERIATPRRVVVVGGGLAGITAALDLAERGFAVTLVERAPHLGGKVAGWSIDALGERFPVEHGFHGFFSQYYTLRDVLASAGADADLVPVDGYPVQFADRPAERFGTTTSLFPLNLLSVVARSPSLHFADFAQDGPGTQALMRYDPAVAFARWDDVDFATFAREQGINRPMVETVLAPFGKTTLNRLDRLSAAEALRFFQFYFMGNPEGLGFAVLGRDADAAVVAPLHRRLAASGVTVRTGLAARRLVLEGGLVRGVAVDAGGAGAAALPIAAAEVPERGWLAVPRAGDAPVWVRRDGDRLLALDGRCTHQGCPVAPDPATGGFRCPCHAGTFDAAGRPTGGPPPRPLEALAVVREGDALVVRAAAPRDAEAIPCDHCVVACDVRGLRRLVADSALPAPAFTAAVAALGTADPYVVLRLWLDRPVRPDREPFATTSGFRYADSLAIYSRFQEPYVGWARRTGGSVVEVHAYAIAPDALGSQDVLYARMLDETWTLLPELRGARVLHQQFMQHDDFTRWAPGDAASRPGTTTPVPNLVLAGDHVRIDAPVALMEAAAMSGRLAANVVLRTEGLRERVVRTVALRGPLA